MPEPSVASLAEVRRLCLEHALDTAFDADGRLRCQERNQENFFGVVLPELRFALLCAAAAADPSYGFPDDPRLLPRAAAVLERVSGQFRDDGRIAGMGDMNSPFFGLIPYANALLLLQGRLPAADHKLLTEKALALYHAARRHIDCTLDYLNPRGMEAATTLALHRLTGADGLRQRAEECLNALLSRQYACGAQPYHTGGWIWGRKPAQAYQLLTATVMLHAGRLLQQPEADDYVRRLLRFVVLTTNSTGRPAVYCFEGLHKAGRGGPLKWIWPLAAALGDEEFRGLGATAMALWQAETLKFATQNDRMLAMSSPATGYLNALENAILLGVDAVPAAPPFTPQPGVHALPDISTIVAHAPGRDVCMTLLTGYSAFMEGVSGGASLLAVTPELTDQPTHSNCGTDPVRLDWSVPTEQDECRLETGGRALLRGRVYSKWDVSGGPGKPDPDLHLHRRKLQVGMEWDGTTAILRYRTLENLQAGPVPARLLFLLVAEPRPAKPRLELADGSVFQLPAATEKVSFHHQTTVQSLRFLAPDGHGFEIVPVQTTAARLLIERQEPMWRPANTSAGIHEPVRPANEGSVRIAFDGPDTLDQGEFLIRFV